MLIDISLECLMADMERVIWQMWVNEDINTWQIANCKVPARQTIMMLIM